MIVETVPGVPSGAIRTTDIVCLPGGMMTGPKHRCQGPGAAPKRYMMTPGPCGISCAMSGGLSQPSGLTSALGGSSMLTLDWRLTVLVGVSARALIGTSV